jgi:4'-phosphopantetheinyl transferase
MLICRLPTQLELAYEQLRRNDLCVICVDVAQGSTRDDARVQIRQALIKVIAAARNLNERDVHLHTEKGHAPHAVIGVGAQCRNYYLSITHEDTYAMAAISSASQVGIDIVKMTSLFDWKHTANLYLGEAAAREIESSRIDQQFKFFLQAWASHEARLKCLGLALQEWSEELEQRLSSTRCEVSYVSWDPTYIAAVARLQSDKHNPAIQKFQFQN